MATDIYEKGNVAVTCYAGPEKVGDRRRYQITTSDGYCSMSREEWLQFVFMIPWIALKEEMPFPESFTPPF